MSAAPRRLSISSLLCDDEPIPKPPRSSSKADKPFVDGDPTNAPLNGPGFSPLAQDGVVRGPPRLVPTSHPSEPIPLIDTNVAVPPPPTVFPKPPQSHSSSGLSSRSLNPRSMEAVLEQAASSSRSQHSQSARTSSRSPTVKRTSLSLSTSIPGEPRSTAFSPPANVTSEPQPLSGSVSPISPQGSHNALEILLRAAEVEANYTRAREERRRSTGHIEPAPYLTPAPALPPTPSSSANASDNQQQVQQHRGPDLMQRSLSGPSRSRSQSQSRSRHSRQQQHQSQTSPQEDTDEWLLDQLGDERPASPPPASPASSSAPSRAPSRASGAKKTKPKPKPKARESASTKKKPPPKSVSMDVDDELLSLVGESSSGAICDREVSESIDAELLATSSGSPAPGPEDATMPPPPNPGTADKPKPKPMPKKKVSILRLEISPISSSLTISYHVACHCRQAKNNVVTQTAIKALSQSQSRKRRCPGNEPGSGSSAGGCNSKGQEGYHRCQEVNDGCGIEVEVWIHHACNGIEARCRSTDTSGRG
jgi:hypothetical protein